MTILDEIQQVADDQARRSLPLSRWTGDRRMRSYVRFGQRFIKGAMVKAMTRANTEVHEKYQRQGLYRQLSRDCEEIARRNDCSYVLVESVLNPVLVPFLLSEGYEPHGTHVMDGLGDYVKCVRG